MTRGDEDLLRSLREHEETLASAPERAVVLLRTVHPADAAEWLHDLDEDDAWRVFSALETEQRAEILEYAEEGLRNELATRLSARELQQLVEELPADEAADLLAEAEDHVVERVLGAIPVEDARTLRDIIAFEPDTAGGVMTTEYVTVPLGARIGDAVKKVKKEGEEAEEIQGVYVLDPDGKPAGYLSDRHLLTHSIHDSVEEAMVEPFTVEAEEDQEEAAQLIAKYGLQALGVVDGDGALLGVISAEDAADILEQEAREDIQKLVGAAPEQQTRLPVLTRLRQRMPLMGVTVLGGLLSAAILSVFLGSHSGDTSSILRYLPLIIGLAGNVGIQSSTILVRALATGELSGEREASVLSAEVLVGLLIGMICGLATLVVASFMEGEAGALHMSFGVAVGGAVFLAVTWAALLGCTVPVVCHRLGIDPAIVAGPFLITLADVSGAAIFVAIADAALGIGGGAGG